MARGRKHHGRSSAASPGRVTRTASRIMAMQAPGAGRWREQHGDKAPFVLFCEALKQERANFRNPLPGDLHRGKRRSVYPCAYGSHWLITSARRHWHIGRAPGPRE